MKENIDNLLKELKEMDFKNTLALLIRLEKEVYLTHKQIDELYYQIMKNDNITSLLNEQVSDLIDEMIDSE